MREGIFLHGTDADLEIGDVIVAGNTISKDNGRSQHAYMTYSSSKDTSNAEYHQAVESAYSWARATCNLKADNSEDGEEEIEAFVYVVKPLGIIEEDGEDEAGDNSYRTSSAIITGVIDAYDLETHLPAVFYGPTFLNL